MTDEMVKEKVYSILCCFDDYCSLHGITYSLAYGTLLGAVRHQGFIPWDDDIDVMLVTNEYLKLRELALRDPYLDETHRYKFMIPGDEYYYYSFIKVVDTHYRVRERNIDTKYHIGLYIDVFRADYWPESKTKEYAQLKYARFLLKANEICIRGNIIDKKLRILDKLLLPVDIVFKLGGVRCEKISKLLEKQGISNPKSAYMGNIMSGSGRVSERLDYRIFSEYTRLQFEGRLFPCHKRYDLELSSIYGNYMTLPPPEKRVSHHNYKVERVFE